jgi:hypothetical protein
VNEARLNPAVFVCESGNAAHAVKSYIENRNSEIEIRKSKMETGKSKLKNRDSEIETRNSKIDSRRAFVLQPRTQFGLCHSDPAVAGEESRQLLFDLTTAETLRFAEDRAMPVIPAKAGIQPYANRAGPPLARG